MLTALIFLIATEPPLDWHQSAALSAIVWESCSLARIKDQPNEPLSIEDIAAAAMATCASAGDRFEEYATKHFVEVQGLSAETGSKMAQKERASLNAMIHKKIAAAILKSREKTND